jgi:hypothetical protein
MIVITGNSYSRLQSAARRHAFPGLCSIATRRRCDCHSRLGLLLNLLVFHRTPASRGFKKHCRRAAHMPARHRGWPLPLSLSSHLHTCRSPEARNDRPRDLQREGSDAPLTNPVHDSDPIASRRVQGKRGGQPRPRAFQTGDRCRQESADHTGAVDLVHFSGHGAQGHPVQRRIWLEPCAARVLSEQRDQGCTRSDKHHRTGCLSQPPRNSSPLTRGPRCRR